MTKLKGTLILHFRVTISAVWFFAAAYSVPYLIVYDVVRISDSHNTTMFFCVQIHNFNFAAYDTSTFAVWYLLPLALITFMYTKISLVLWKTSKGSTFGRLSTGSISYTKNHCEVTGSGTGNIRRMHDNNPPAKGGNSCHSTPRQHSRDMYDRRWQSRQSRTSREPLRYSSKNLRHGTGRLARPFLVVSGCKTCSPETNVSRSPKHRRDMLDSNACRKNNRHMNRDADEAEPSFTKNPSASSSGGSASRTPRRVSTLSSVTHRSSGMPSVSALLARRKVIRLLIAVIVSFALCALPYHIRLLWQSWGNPQMSFGEFLLPPITFVIYYFSSALNPLLYAFLSLNFRIAMRDILTCRRRDVKRSRSFIVHRQATVYACHRDTKCRTCDINSLKRRKCQKVE